MLRGIDHLSRLKLLAPDRSSGSTSSAAPPEIEVRNMHHDIVWEWHNKYITTVLTHIRDEILRGAAGAPELSDQLADVRFTTSRIEGDKEGFDGRFLVVLFAIAKNGAATKIRQLPGVFGPEQVKNIIEAKPLADQLPGNGIFISDFEATNEHTVVFKLKIRHHPQ